MSLSSARHISVALSAWALFTLLSPAHLTGADRAAAETQPAHEYQVKAAFLYNFLKFVEWPPREVGASPHALCIGVLGSDPFGVALDAIAGKAAYGRNVVVRQYRKVEDAKDCDILFISASERGRLAHILKNLQNAPVLTVADQEGFCRAGGMINLITVRNRISFEINVSAARNAGLRISSQLLKLAKAVIE